MLIAYVPAVECIVRTVARLRCERWVLLNAWPHGSLAPSPEALCTWQGADPHNDSLVQPGTTSGNVVVSVPHFCAALWLQARASNRRRLRQARWTGCPTTGPHVVRYSLRATACSTPPRADSLVDFAKLDVRIGHILEAKIHPDADRYAREPGSCVASPIGTRLRPISKTATYPLCAPHSL